MHFSLRKTYGRKTQIVVICTMLCILQSFALFQADTTIGTGPIVRLSFFMQFFLSVAIVVGFNKDFHTNSSVTFLLLSVFFWWLFESVINYYNGIAFFSIISPFILSVYILLSDQTKALAYKAFREVFFWISIAGIITYLLYVFNIFPPLSMNDFYEEDAIAQYANYGIAYVFVPNTAIGFNRLCGLFNEPGYLGTLAAFVLIIDEVKINVKNIVILIAGIMSFSMAFYVIIAVYLIFKLIITRNLKLLVVILILAAGYIYLSSKEIVNDDLARFVNRFVFDEGRFSGDDRVGSNDESVWRNVLRDPAKLWLGYGQYYDFEGSSYQSLIIKHGILGFVAMFLPLFIGALKSAKKNKTCIALVVCFMVSIYQRTQVFNVALFTVLLGGIQYLMLKENLYPVNIKDK